MNQQNILIWIICCHIVHSIAGDLFWCDRASDPCLEASSTSMYQEYLRSENCPPKSEHYLCDRYLQIQWYKTEEDLLSHCPSLHSCGAEFPLWMNESLPSVSDGIVDRTVCKRGFGDCCVKTYGIKIKNCTSFMAYCLIPPGGCTERYCFGENGTCEAPPESITTSMVGTITGLTNQTTRHYRKEDDNENDPEVFIWIGTFSGLLGSGSVTIIVVVIRKNKKDNKVIDKGIKKSTIVNIHIPDTNFDSKEAKMEKTQS
ncbi:oncoprotein-induced transcript 3 protein-like [Saccostrea cucullata]|uniref:oncoprotein-induced transcript 3 protein-like n=1 Tax=Saccostrea cuccullata TaxID=36930 RepID=UPI002ED627AA